MTDTEWLQTNARGSFSMGTASRIPTRKYHGLLIVRDVGQDQPLHVLLEVSERLDTPQGSFELGTFAYPSGIFPLEHAPIGRFEALPHPLWSYQLGELTLLRELWLDPEQDSVTLRYHISGPTAGVRLYVRPLLTCRPLHKLTQENPSLNGRTTIRPDSVTLRPYRELPAVQMQTSPAARFLGVGYWNRDLCYTAERDRGHEFSEDAYCPGQFLFELEQTQQCELRIGVPAAAASTPDEAPGTELEQAADQFLTDGPGIIAGYPWFGEWGRDTFIALPGLTLARGEHQTACAILDRWSAVRINGLVPNILPADVHSIDASLWFVRAVQALEAAAGPELADRYAPVIGELLECLRHPTALGTHQTEDGELWVEPGPRPLTWMDAIVDGQPVTPRAPLAVEIQALYHNALRYGARQARRSGLGRAADAWDETASRLGDVFLRRFWLEDVGYLADVHDGTTPDRALRPNQLIAAGLPDSPLPAELASRLLGPVDEWLLTPFGLRTLSPEHPDYRGQCAGGPAERDAAYHQGTVWPWLLGPYADTLLRALPEDEAHYRIDDLLAPFSTHLEDACAGQISEIFDGDDPHTPRGAPAQAWSVAELLRLARLTGAPL